MDVTWQAQVLCSGSAEGPVLRLDAPISFWGGVDPETSQITAAGHPQFGEEIADTLLVMPRLIGSSSSSGVLLELIYQKRCPLALILGEADAILPVGALVAREMAWGQVPLVLVRDPPFQTGQRLKLGSNGLISQM